MSPDPHFARRPPVEEAPPAAAAGGTRAEAVQRLQIGLIGLAAMILMVMLANIVMERANQTDATAVPEAVDDGGAGASAGNAKDPLADAGVIPDLPAGDETPDRAAPPPADAP